MSGPTGVAGAQGLRGYNGPPGATGIAGMYGPQGAVGPVGPVGPTGIAGSTGIQLYGNNSLIQCASYTNSLEPVGTVSAGYTGISMPTKTPPLSGNLSTTISGQYDASGLNYYGSPMSMSDEFIVFPAGKYYISACLPTNYNGNFNANKTFLELSSWDGSTYTPIVKSIPAYSGSANHLQYYYTPTTDTTVALRVNISNSSGSLYTYSSINPLSKLTIVKIW